VSEVPSFDATGFADGVGLALPTDSDFFAVLEIGAVAGLGDNGEGLSEEVGDQWVAPPFQCP
jgi:hypothetical protein